MWEVALSNITSKATTYSEYWLLFYFIWMKSNIFKMSELLRSPWLMPEEFHWLMLDWM